MRLRLTPEDYAAFDEFHRELLKSRLLVEAEEQARQGGPPLTEMGLPAINDWLQAFHAEIGELVKREREGSGGNG
jgi:hypothetical protein